ncbi:Radical SAM domain protein [Solidesulfovibrio carbinoliphilus subsp. oakridgensis]|uniref:Radical SAM domain protein n=1 Tax=Solidesulfovibrio carbinoliphilus subsp. oakridgensis TaxID=694327 RepID=G7QE06_9BACT|nr:radical SAM protein [Solidesulfovibrio carbinoliphilus]EHJ46662.1 Radical SAM domain protein [Solidesulfovibrio carbinoliphilus subsp. oakridgensis]
MPIMRILRWRGRPRQVVVQLTDRCNARCVQCGMNVAAGGPRGDLDRDAAKRIIDRCAALGVAALSFTGGEPFLAGPLLLDLLDYAGRAGITYLRTGTNGYRFAHPDAPDFTDRVARLAEGLAATRLRNFWISLDSADAATHEANRGHAGMVAGLARALPIFHDHGLFPTANLALNRFMGGPEPLGGNGETLREAACRDLSRFFEKAAGLGFTMANCCYPMSDADAGNGARAVYAATASDARVTFSDAEKLALFSAVRDTVPRHRDKLRIFTPLVAIHALLAQYDKPSRARRPSRSVRPCLGGVSFFYVDRHGDAFPCGYRAGENLGPFWKLSEDRLGGEPHCLSCDWECFRDPSELLGPLGDLAAGPAGWLRLLRANREQLGLWLTDLRYFAACDQFDGRVPPNFAKLRRFSRT